MPTTTRPLPRILLRQWVAADLGPYIAMNADPEVMRFFPRTLTADESRASFERIRSAIETRGWGLWAVEVDGCFAGFTGLSVPTFGAPFMPCVEIGWRLRPEFWGRGIGLAAASEALARGFGPIGLAEIVSFTSIHNLRSRALMERLGMTRDRGGDFDHPSIDASNPIRHHVLYRKRRPGSAPAGV